MDYKIITCIKCRNKLKVPISANKFNCVCGQQYEYIEAYSDKIKLLENVGE